jgi:NADH:ubiquinone oxidoreductase subunit F (NADH-binding)
VNAIAPEWSLPTVSHGVPGLLPAHGTEDYEQFIALYGPRPIPGTGLIDAVAESGLAGRGGAAFPTARKLQAVRAGRRAVVVANGTEGEPASHKDKVLMRSNPHLVIDGALLAAEAVRARRVILAVGCEGYALGPVQEALESRRDGSRVELVATPEGFVAGEESALVNYLNGGEAKPTMTPPRPFEQGVEGRATLVQNVETLASLALIARYGPGWFRSIGTAAESGPVLATIGGAVQMPGVLEASLGDEFCQLFARCGGLTEPAQAYLVGGYFGSWVAPDERLRLSDESLTSVGAKLGARAIVALATETCGVTETARVVAYMAAQSAEQCGPCVFGLRTLAQRLQTIADTRPGAGEAYSQLAGLHRQIARRGACAHPDGVLQFAASATHVFADEFSAHLAGHCTVHTHEPVLPTPTQQEEWR